MQVPGQAAGFTAMMGERAGRQKAHSHGFDGDDHVPADHRLRSRGPLGARHESHRAAAAQNLRKLAKLMRRGELSQRIGYSYHP